MVDLGVGGLILTIKKEIAEGRKTGRTSKTKPPSLLSSRSGPATDKASYFLYVEVNTNAADNRAVSKSVVKTKLK